MPDEPDTADRRLKARRIKRAFAFVQMVWTNHA
jgi:hypothetical protein